MSSGKVRLNANGKKLDAWLIYRCTQCDGTWNRPVFERRPVHMLAAADLDAMQRSAPEWVRGHEFDIAALARLCDRVDTDGDVEVCKPPPPPRLPGGLGQLDLEIIAPHGSGIRLDRLLARELAISRSRLQALEYGGRITVRPAAKSPLRRTVRGRISVRFVAGGPDDGAEFERLCRSAYA